MIVASDPFIGLCRITRAGFAAAIMARAHNPGLEGERGLGAYWDECRAWGVCPLFLLSMAIHEGQLLTAGVARDTRSWGNTRSPSFGAVPIDLVPGRSGHFPVFASFLDGIAATAGRLASPSWPTIAPYGLRTSIRQVFDHPSGATWAPAGDADNDPNSYLGSMLRLMNEYTDQDDEWIAATRPPAPPVVSDYLTVNFSTGRGGRQPQAVILHITQGATAGSCMNWFKSPRSQVSAHYVIDRDGTIYAAVRESDTAWANGQLNAPNTDLMLVERWVKGGINPNSETCSIECAGFSSRQPAGQPAELVGYTEAQFASLDLLLGALARRHDLAIDQDDCFGHCEIDSVNRANCPGLSESEWDRIYRGLAATTGDGPYGSPDDAYDSWCATWDDTVAWAGSITGKAHWTGREPQEIARTAGNRLLAYDGGYARDVTGYVLDEWSEARLADGSLTMYGG